MIKLFGSVGVVLTFAPSGVDLCIEISELADADIQKQLKWHAYYAHAAFNTTNPCDE